MSDEGAVRTHRDGAVLHLTLDRPGRRNTLSHNMTGTLVEVLSAAAADDTLRALHITGAGDDFCAGADWVSTNAGGSERPRTANLVRRIPHTSHRVVELIHDIHLPVVCSVRGWAVGLGCNLALVSDFTVAAADAVFWEPFTSRGFSPDSGASWLLPRLIGVARAKRMLLLAEKVSAGDAADWGLIHQTVRREDFDATVTQLLARLADGPTVALGLAKQGIHHGQHSTLGQAMKQELFNLELSCRTLDFKEGLAAFGERRTPDFQGR
ncbi:enoyl-CoA hydratase/isomerase family protein [Mycolicibacterium litorale]|uniref:enoyl-CoA hydratase/isomerase family protein n=1 Tax=Mycolicibacterium litorale TaxID=758802 RepID=UPI0039A0221E